MRSLLPATLGGSDGPRPGLGSVGICGTYLLVSCLRIVTSAFTGDPDHARIFPTLKLGPESLGRPGGVGT